MGLTTGQEGINLIKQFEGCRLTAYKCPAGVWTIGYGHTAGIKQGQVITQEQADRILVEDLKKYEKKVNKYYDKYQWKQNEFDALVSFAFNVGSIDQLSANGTRSKEVIGNKILSYNKAGGKELAGLTRRRKAEQKLFLSMLTSVTLDYPVLKKGSKGTMVRKLQQQLKERGYDLVCDGVFGNKTLEMVRAFQADNRIAVDGVVGKNTWSKVIG